MDHFLEKIRAFKAVFHKIKLNYQNGRLKNSSIHLNNPFLIIIYQSQFYLFLIHLLSNWLITCWYFDGKILYNEIKYTTEIDLSLKLYSYNFFFSKY